ncbi:glycine oxidase ThiO [Paenibacillus marchantiophytorum]|uniref:glycine oxidase n=1 Tax=Paenibacillus marchantiophytorum TaxID=1619310 RepID=A0ABQ2BX77_9BACL|nr:glycine oxidase ThiO [Paenibacillus marchantiophytorum]GGI46747.1 glycine oxidase ThiO [Paenibacillus marchantiophytorum]
MKQTSDVLIVGGGVIGSSIAYYLAKRGQAVTLLERSRLGTEASAAAAGMLGAQSEMADTGPLFQWARHSRAMFPQLSEELKDLTGIDIGLVREGLLNVAFSDEQERELRAREKLQLAAGEQAQWLSAAAAAKLEPALGEATRGALYLPEDGQVEAPRLAAAYAQAARALGAKVQEFAQVQALLKDGSRISGVMTSEGPLWSEQVIVAAGTWSGQLLTGIGIELPMYPVKGECFSVLTPKQELRKTLFTPGCYIVPKAGGRLLVGATMVPHSYDRKVSMAGLAELMDRARQLMPAIGAAEWEKAWSGLRPQTADGLPYIGKVPEYEGLYAACGHYRNGIVLSPITGKVIADQVVGELGTALGVEPWLDAFSPDFSAVSKRVVQQDQSHLSATNGSRKELQSIEAAH